MPTIIDHPEVLSRMTARGFVSNYHNGGSFSFPKGTATHVVAHVGPPDPTIRPAALPFTIPVAEPYEMNLARVARRVWEQLGRVVWLLPLAHWAFELDPVTQPWFPEMLRGAGIDPTPLVGLNTAAAIQFEPAEAPGLERVLAAILTHLVSSDFGLVFLEKPLICSVHHHKQLWWVTSDATLAEKVRRVQPQD
jgi:hypothetical protein